jgi:hypothetical protein
VEELSARAAVDWASPDPGHAGHWEVMAFPSKESSWLVAILQASPGLDFAHLGALARSDLEAAGSPADYLPDPTVGLACSDWALRAPALPEMSDLGLRNRAASIPAGSELWASAGCQSWSAPELPVLTKLVPLSSSSELRFGYYVSRCLSFYSAINRSISRSVPPVCNSRLTLPPSAGNRVLPVAVRENALRVIDARIALQLNPVRQSSLAITAFSGYLLSFPARIFDCMEAYPQ